MYWCVFGSVKKFGEFVKIVELISFIFKYFSFAFYCQNKPRKKVNFVVVVWLGSSLWSRDSLFLFPIKSFPFCPQNSIQLFILVLYGLVLACLLFYFSLPGHINRRHHIESINRILFMSLFEKAFIHPAAAAHQLSELHFQWIVVFPAIPRPNPTLINRNNTIAWTSIVWNEMKYNQNKWKWNFFFLFIANFHQLMMIQFCWYFLMKHLAITHTIHNNTVWIQSNWILFTIISFYLSIFSFLLVITSVNDDYDYYQLILVNDWMNRTSNIFSFLYIESE